MKFLLDAQLPQKLSLFLFYKGNDSLHTLDLPHKNRSKDSELNTLLFYHARKKRLQILREDIKSGKEIMYDFDITTDMLVEELQA